MQAMFTHTRTHTLHKIQKQIACIQFINTNVCTDNANNTHTELPYDDEDRKE